MFAAQLRAPLYEDKVVDFLFAQGRDHRPQGDPRRSSKPTSRARKAMSTVPAAATTMRDEKPKAKKAAAKGGARPKAARRSEAGQSRRPRRRRPTVEEGIGQRQSRPSRSRASPRNKAAPRRAKPKAREGRSQARRQSEEAGQEGLSEREIVCEDLNLAIDDLQRDGAFGSTSSIRPTIRTPRCSARATRSSGLTTPDAPPPPDVLPPFAPEFVLTRAGASPARAAPACSTAT